MGICKCGKPTFGQRRACFACRLKPKANQVNTIAARTGYQPVPGDLTGRAIEARLRVLDRLRRERRRLVG
jgi:hypothetical protein